MDSIKQIQQKGTRMKTKIKAYDWTELHETNLNGVLDPSMMTHEGKVTTVALSRLKKQGTRGVSPEPRQVYFDRRFILYRIVRQLKKFNYLDVSDLLREILAHVSSPEEFEKFFNEINKSPDDSQADKEKGKPARKKTQSKRKAGKSSS